MRTMHRLLAALVPLALVAAACGSATQPATPSAAPTASPDIVPAASTVPVKTPKMITAPPPTPPASVEPMAPAHVTGVTTLVQSDAGTEAGSGDRQQLRGIVVKSTAEMSDPRVSGTGTGRISVDTVGSFGWETVDLVIENDDGTWEGTCSGAAWSSGNASDFSCWLLGTGDYQGLTYYLHVSSFGSTSNDEGVILPLPAPAAP